MKINSQNSTHSNNLMLTTYTAKTISEVKGDDVVCFSLLTPIKQFNVPIYRRSQTSP